jgi:hypothetical protein
VAPDGTVPASFRVTDCPAGSEDRLQVPVVGLKDRPDGRFGLETPASPWAGSVSTTFTLAASDGPVFKTTMVYVSADPAITALTPSVLVIVRVAWVFRASVSVAVTGEASVADAVAVFVYEVPVAPDGTVPANCNVTDCPVGREARLQLSVAAENVTPAGRFGLEMFVSP